MNEKIPTLFTFLEGEETMVVWRTEHLYNGEIYGLQGLDKVPIECEVRRTPLPSGCGEIIRYVTRVKDPSFFDIKKH